MLYNSPSAGCQTDAFRSGPASRIPLPGGSHSASERRQAESRKCSNQEMKNSDFQNKSRVRNVIYVQLVSHYITNSAIILNVDWPFYKIARRVEKGNDVRSGAM